MLLEDLRAEELGRVFAFVRCPAGAAAERVALTFHDLAIQGFYLTCSSLEELENARGLWSAGRYGPTPAVVWFNALEAFVNAELKVFCLGLGQDFGAHRSKTITSRIDALLHVADVERARLRESGILRRINDFSQFRNEILHDRFVNHPLSFHHTSFSPVPYSANQVDNIQAALICVELFQWLRRLVPGVDLMPSIYVTVRDSADFVKLDRLMSEVLHPYFVDVLAKQNLASGITLAVPNESLDASPRLQPGQVQVAIRAHQTLSAWPAPAESRTTIGETYMERIRESCTVAAGCFRVPDYGTRQQGRAV
jgi:hypothetical protein